MNKTQKILLVSLGLLFSPAALAESLPSKSEVVFTQEWEPVDGEVVDDAEVLEAIEIPEEGEGAFEVSSEYGEPHRVVVPEGSELVKVQKIEPKSPSQPPVVQVFYQLPPE